MPKVADYKVLNENGATLNNTGDTLTVNFELPPGALLVDLAQRPFITFSESASGAGPLVVSITLNGTSINTHTYNQNPQMATRTVIVNGSSFVQGQNTLVFTLTSGGGNVTIKNVITHFQQEA